MLATAERVAGRGRVQQGAARRDHSQALPAVRGGAGRTTARSSAAGWSRSRSAPDAQDAPRLTATRACGRSRARGWRSWRRFAPTVSSATAAQTHPADGAAGMIVTTREQARELGVEGPYARLLASGFARVAPGTMPKAPVPAAAAALRDAGLELREIEIVKTHNPFAVNDLWFAARDGFRRRGPQPVRMQPRLRTSAGADRRPRDRRADPRARRARRRARPVHRLRRG